MKLIAEGRERDWYLADEWTTKSGLKAVVRFCKWKKSVKDISSFVHDYYTGYVQVPEGVEPNENGIDVYGGVTFSKGKIEGFDGEWIGFDMDHLGDESTQSQEYAKEQCEKLAEQVK